MTIAQDIQKLYIAYFNRPADFSGLTYWENQANHNGGSVAAVANAFSASPEYINKYAGMTNLQVIDTIYHNLFNRPAEAAGLKFWSDAMTNGIDIGRIAVAILNGAQNADKTAITNKVAAAQAFYTALDTATEITGYEGEAANAVAANWLKGITTDATLAAATSATALNTVLGEVVNAHGHAGDGVFTLTEVSPTLAKTFVWQDVDMTALRDMISYANQVDNRGGNVVTDADLNGGTGAGESLFFDSAYVKALTQFIEDYKNLVDEQVVFHPARLTTSGGTVGVVETGNTTGGDDLIVAGTSYALHGAYIDGGQGYNTLDVEMKGPFAQAKQLLNIQEVDVQNATNYYTPSLFGFNNSTRTNTGSYDLSTFLQGGPDGTAGSISVLDLTNARQLQKLVVTESEAQGKLIVLGIKNYADTKLVGGFDQDVVLHYTDLGTNAGTQLNLEVVNVDFGTASAQGNLNSGKLILGHNAGVVAITSNGASNTLGDVDFGGRFKELIVKGSASLTIEGDLEFAHNVATVDASANTGGLFFNINTQGTVDSLEEIHILGSTAKDVVSIQGTSAGVLLDIDLGAGSKNVLNLDTVDAAAGSVINGDNLTVNINGANLVHAGDQGGTTNLTLADISGVDHFVINDGPGTDLIITAAQFTDLGAAAFAPLHRDEQVTLKIVVPNTGSTVLLSDLVTLSELNSHVKLEFDIAFGATLSMTAEQLDTYVAPAGIVLGNAAGESKGKLIITNAGLSFSAFNATQVVTNQDYAQGGTIVDNWATNGYNLTVVRSVTGWDRPNADSLSDVLTIDSTGGAITVNANAYVDATKFNLDVNKLVITGANDVTFTAPVDFTGVNYTVDFSALTGALHGLTLANFEDITDGVDPTLWGKVVGNGVAGSRVDVGLTGNVGNNGLGVDKGGIVSSGVDIYVVTSMDGNYSFNVCDTTKGLKTLGLQGNAGKTVTFNNAAFGVTFLMEGDGKADWTALPKAVGSPNTSNIGTLNAKYFLYDAAFTANVEINNRGVELGVKTDGTPRAFSVDGINIDNAKTLVVTIHDGDAGITGINAVTINELKSVTIISDNDVSLNLTATASNLTTFNAADVDGTMTLNMAVATIDLSAAAVSGVDAIVLTDNDGLGGATNLTLSVAQLTAIGVANITHASYDALVDAKATVNLTGLDSTPFSVASFNTGIQLGTVTVADPAGHVVTLDPTTDLTGATNVVVPAGVTLNMTATQFLEITGGNITGAGTVNITGITQADIDAGLDLSTITAVNGTITEAANLVLKAGTDLAHFSIDLANAQTITLVTPDQAYRAIDGGTTTSVNLAFANAALVASGDTIYTTTAHDTIVAYKAALATYMAATTAINAADLVAKYSALYVGVGGDGAGPAAALTAAAIVTARFDVADDLRTNDAALVTAINSLGVAGIDTSGYSNVTHVIVPTTLVAGFNVEQILAYLQSQSIVDIVAPAVLGLAAADTTDRAVTIEAGATVAGGLVFADLTDTGLVKTLTLDLLGGSKVTGGAIDISTIEDLAATVTPEFFDTLTINSLGTVANVLTDIKAGTDGALGGTANDLLNVVINATGSALTVGTIFFSGVAEDSTATLTVNGTKNVTIAQLDTTDGEVTTLNIVNNLTGGAVLTITGGSPTIDDSNVAAADDVAGVSANTTLDSALESIVLSGAGAVVLGTAAAATGISSNTLSLIDASALTGALTLGKIVDIDDKDFTFKANATATTTLTLDTLTLDDSGLNAAVLAYNTALAAYETAPVVAGEDAALVAAYAGVRAVINGGVYDPTNVDPMAAAPLIANVVAAKAATAALIAANLVDWNFQLGTGTTLTIKDANFLDGALVITGGKVTVEGALDTQGLDIVTFTGVPVTLAAGASLQMSDAQYAAFVAASSTIAGAGTTFYTDTAVPLDLTVYRGLTAVQIEDTTSGALTLTAAQALVAYEVDSATGVPVRATWDDDSNVLTAEVDRANGDLSDASITSVISVVVNSSTDISTLKGIDHIILPNDTTTATKHDIALTIQNTELAVLETAAPSVLIHDVLAQLSALTVNVSVDLGTTDINGNPNIAASSFTTTFDPVDSLWDVVGNAAAIGTAQKLTTVETNALLADADIATITWTAVGSTASKSINTSGTADLVATAGASDTFVFAATPDVATVANTLDIGGFVGGVLADADRIDLNAFTADVAFAGANAVGVDMAIARTITADDVFLITGGAAGDADSLAAAATAITANGAWTNAANGVVAYFVVVDNNSTAIYKYTENTGAEVDVTELALIGNISSTTIAGDYLFA